MQHSILNFTQNQELKRKELSFKFDENHKPVIEGSFTFVIDKNIYCDTEGSYRPKMNISFDWNPEMQQDIHAFNDNLYNEIYEAIGEKLKQDFIELIKKEEQK